MYCQKHNVELAGSAQPEIERSEVKDICYWCEKHFNDGEAMTAAYNYSPGRKLLCRGCVEMLIGMGMLFHVGNRIIIKNADNAVDKS
jgi:hypothetical protein